MLRRFRLRLAAFSRFASSRRIAEGDEGGEKGKRGGPPPGWQKFVDQKLKGRKVPNPDKDASRKEILITTAMKKDKGIRDKVMREYAEWAKKQKSLGKKKPSTNKEKETKDNEKKDTKPKKPAKKFSPYELDQITDDFNSQFDSGVEDLDDTDLVDDSLLYHTKRSLKTSAKVTVESILKGEFDTEEDLEYFKKDLKESLESQGMEESDIGSDVIKHLTDKFLDQVKPFLEDYEVDVPDADLKRSAESYALSALAMAVRSHK